MTENELNGRPSRHYIMSLIYILVLVALGFIVVGPFIGFFIALIFYPGTTEQLLVAIQSPTEHPDVKISLFIIQGFVTLIGLILTPMLILRRYQTPLREFFGVRRFDWVPFAVTAFIVVVFVGVNSWFAEWNHSIDFPDVFEEWARSREDAAAEMTELLTTLSNSGELLIAILVIAILPAIGEEIVFRGLIQNELFRGTRNVHLSIWIAAVLFSAIHFQFYGFVPRLLLGALFGYLYYWSGNLWLAIFAHFVNNAVSVIAMYYYQQGAFEFDLESQQALPLPAVLTSAVLTTGLLYFFYKYFEARKPPIPHL